MHYFGKKMHKTKVFLHKSENTLERDSDIIRIYVLPNNIMYKRSTDQSAGEMLRNNGFISLQFSGNIAVIRTRPGYASSMAYDIDNNEFSEILGTIAGDDTIMLVLREGVATSKIRQLLSLIIPNIE